MSGQIFSRETLSNAVSGSLASMLALALFYPLDRVRGVAQMQRHLSSVEVFRLLLKSEGITGLYTGVRHMLVVLGSSNFVYFYIHALLKITYLQRTKKEQVSNFINLIFATIAGVVNVLVTNPLWVVATRFALQRKMKEKEKKTEPPIMPLNLDSSQTRKRDLNSPSSNEQKVGEETVEIKSQCVPDNIVKNKSPTGIIDSLVFISREEGLKALWSGCGTSLMLVSNPAIQFTVYEKIKRIISQLSKRREFSSVEYLVIGAFAKMVATIFTYPLQLSQTRLRSSSDPNETTLKCLLKIYSSDGIFGLFKGLDAKLLQTCLTAAFMFVFYEKLLILCRKLILL